MLHRAELSPGTFTISRGPRVSLLSPRKLSHAWLIEHPPTEKDRGIEFDAFFLSFFVMFLSFLWNSPWWSSTRGGKVNCTVLRWGSIDSGRCTGRRNYVRRGNSSSGLLHPLEYVSRLVQNPAVLSPLLLRIFPRFLLWILFFLSSYFPCCSCIFLAYLLRHKIVKYSLFYTDILLVVFFNNWEFNVNGIGELKLE